MARCSALVIAAPASGQGKTTVVAALARLHARLGRRVRVFKCGPDYLDPHWHRLASGAPVHPLDLWLTGEQDCRQRLHQAAGEADLILIEGVMGLFDGEHSAAQLARTLRIPVLAVIDASAMGGTLGALAHGLRSYWPDLPWAGVLANRVASERHAQMLQDGLRDAGDWLGALPAIAIGEPGSRPSGRLMPERHLGLVAAHELPDALARLDAAADALAATPLGRMAPAELQRWAVDFHTAGSPSEALPQWLAGRTVAVAQDDAFCLVYEANLETLRALGARVVVFSPLQGNPLPDCDALWLPGGYPELHAPALGQRHDLRAQLQAHAAAGRPIWAEGGGLLALLQGITLQDGSTLPLWGLLPGHATMHARLAAIGPREWRLPGCAPLRGHSLHYSTVRSDAQVCGQAVRPDGTDAPPSSGAEAVYCEGSIRASYFQAWFASNPRAVAQLLGAVQRT